jgi:predicted ABC-class ATPase
MIRFIEKSYEAENSREACIRELLKYKKALETAAGSMGDWHIQNTIDALKKTEQFYEDAAATRVIVASMLLRMLIERQHVMPVTDAIYLNDVAGAWR